MLIFNQHCISPLGIDTRYINLIPREVHIRHGFVERRFRMDDRNTLFKEIEVLPAKEIITPSVRRAFKATPQREESKVKLFEKMYSRLRQVILDTWKPEMAHIFLHSSGIDSRVLSWILKELHNELGDSWLGDVIFVCSKWEASNFKGIMRYEGWDESQFLVLRENAPYERYYEPNLVDFENAWTWANGVEAIPVNLFWYLVDAAEERLGTNSQVYSGSWGNTVLDNASGPEAGEGLRKKYKLFYWGVGCRRPFKGKECVYPYTDSELAWTIGTSKQRLGHKLRFEFVNYIDTGLAKFTNEDSDGDRHRRIASDIMSKMISDYDKSWYGKNIAPGARPKHRTTEFQAFWSRWTSASLCEHLIKNGYTIRKG